MATIAARQKTLPQVLQSLQAQHLPFSEIHLYCNDWDGPDEMPGVIIHRAPEGDLGDVGKLYGCGEGYNFLCDDDFIYPPDYSRRLKAAIDRTGRIVGAYGIRLPWRVAGYFSERTVFHFRGYTVFHRYGRVIYHQPKRLEYDLPMHVLGSGLLAYHSDHFRPDRRAIEHPNMTDCYLGVQAQQQAVGMRCIARPPGWLKPINYRNSLWMRRGDDRLQTEIVRGVGAWRFY